MDRQEDPAHLLRLVRGVCELRALGTDADRQLGLVEIAALLGVDAPARTKLAPLACDLDFQRAEQHAIVGRGLLWVANRTEFRLGMHFENRSDKASVLLVQSVEPMPGDVWPE